MSSRERTPSITDTGEFRVPLKGTIKGSFKGIYKGSIKGFVFWGVGFRGFRVLGFRV